MVALKVAEMAVLMADSKAVVKAGLKALPKVAW